MAERGDTDAGRGKSDAWHVKAARMATPGGIVAILVAVITQFSALQDTLDRNCQATQQVAATTAVMASIDNELSRPANAHLRRELADSLHRLPAC